MNFNLARHLKLRLSTSVTHISFCDVNLFIPDIFHLIYGLKTYSIDWGYKVKIDVLRLDVLVYCIYTIPELFPNMKN